MKFFLKEENYSLNFIILTYLKAKTGLFYTLYLNQKVICWLRTVVISVLGRAKSLYTLGGQTAAYREDWILNPNSSRPKIDTPLLKKG